jgi:hypothetical protein
MSYDPYENPGRVPADGKFKWVPRNNPSAGGTVGLGWNFLTLTSGRFRNDYFVSDVDSSVIVTEYAKNSSGNLSPYNPINRAFRKLQTPNKFVSIVNDDYSLKSTDFYWQAKFKTPVRISAIKLQYNLLVNIADPALIGLMEQSGAANSESDIEKVRAFLGGATVIMDIDWSKYVFTKIKIYVAGEDDSAGTIYPADNSELKTSGYYYNNFESNDSFKTTTVRFGTTTIVNDYKVIERVRIINSGIAVKLYLRKAMFFNAVRCNIPDANLPCKLLSYAIPIDFKITALNTMSQYYWPNNNTDPTYSVKVFTPDDLIKTRGFAHSINIRFLIAGFPQFGLGALNNTIAGLLADINNPSWIIVIFVGPILGKQTSIFYLTPNTISGLTGRLVRVGNTIILDSTTRITIQKFNSTSKPLETDDWQLFYEYNVQETIAISDFQPSPWIFYDSSATSKSWYRIIQKNENTGALTTGQPFLGELYTEKTTLELNTTGSSSATTSNIIRYYSQSSQNPLDLDPIAFFTINPTQDDLYGSSISFRKGIFKFHFKGRSVDANYAVSTHLFIRMWFHPGTSEVDPENPHRHRGAGTEIIFKTYETASGTSTKTVIGTPESLDDLIVSAPLPQDFTDFDVIKFTDGLTDRNDVYSSPFTSPTTNIVVAIYTLTYPTGTVDPAAINRINPPSIEIQIDPTVTRLETTLLKNTSGTLSASRYYDFTNATYQPLQDTVINLNNKQYSGIQYSSTPDKFIKYEESFQKINSTNNPFGISYNNLLTLAPSNLDKLKIYLETPNYALTNDKSVVYFIDFVTTGNSFTGAKVNTGSWTIQIGFDVDIDTNRKRYSYRIMAFFVDVYGTITERLFVSPFLTDNVSNVTYQTTINYPFYVSGEQSQLVFRLYVYPYSSNGSEITQDELNEITESLKDKPLGVRIETITITTTDSSILKLNLTEPSSSGTRYYEDLQIIPSTSLDSQQFWFAGDANTMNFLQFMETSAEFIVSGAVYSPTWYINMPKGTEVFIKGNPFLQNDFGTLGVRTVLGAEDEVAEEKIAAIEIGLENTTHIAANSKKSDSVTILSDTNQIVQYKLNDPLNLPLFQGLVTGLYNNVVNILSGENPSLINIDYNTTDGQRSALVIAAENSDENSAYLKSHVSTNGGLLNTWKTPTIDGFSADLNSIVLKVSKNIDKMSVAYSSYDKHIYVAGLANPGALIMKKVSLLSAAVTDAESYLIKGYTYVLDGPSDIASTIIYDKNESVVYSNSLSGLNVLSTHPGLTIDQYGNVMVAYVLEGRANEITGLAISSLNNLGPKPFSLVDMATATTGNVYLNVFCPVLYYYEKTKVVYIAFWCAGKIFMAHVSCVNGFQSYVTNYITMVGGNRNINPINNQETNKAHPSFREMVDKGFLILNSTTLEESDVPVQAPGFFISNSGQNSGSLYIYYRLLSGELVGRQVYAGGSVSALYKIAD